MNDEFSLVSVQSLQNYFDEKITGENIEQIKIALTQIIVNMMLNDMEKLLAILYRIDVNEKKVKQAFTQSNPAFIAPTIAELIIARELQKEETRRKYKGE
jgi:hypothetical protein